MAVLTLQHNKSEFEFIHKLRKMFPELRAQMLGFVGNEGKKILKRKFLSGQEINLNAYPRDSKGRRTIKYSVGKNANAVTVSSYPLNFFEGGRLLRSGEKEPAKKIMKMKFKQAMESDSQRILDKFDTLYLQKKIGKF